MDPIEQYLDDLATKLRLTPLDARRMLAETEDHLLDLVAAEEAAGHEGEDATRRALARFGSAHEVALAANGGSWSAVLALGAGAARLAAVGCATVLAGTLLARLLAQLTSTGWVFGLPADVIPSASDIAHWLQVQPGAHGWRQAAALENADDTLLWRGGAAALGLLLAGAVVLLLRRRLPKVDSGLFAAMGFTAFAGAALALAAGSLGGPGAHVEWGRGQSLSDVAVAALAAAWYGVRMLRGLRTA